MENDTLEDNCECPMDCDSISYSSYSVSTPLNPEKMCLKQKNGVMKEILKNKFPPQFVRNLRKFVDNVTSNEIEICKRNIQYRAEVTFQLATNTMSVTVISRRLSFFDKLSGFGKDLSNIFYSMKTFHFRWNFGTFYWDQHSQHGRSHLLDCQNPGRVFGGKE